jgi:hypothetical protein
MGLPHALAEGRRPSTRHCRVRRKAVPEEAPVDLQDGGIADQLASACDREAQRA